MKQIKVAHKALKEYENANLWLNLPADQTTNAFLQSIGCTSRHTLESALKRLENNTPSRESIRSAVFQKRESLSTTPIPIAWEITDLLKNIYRVYTQKDFSESEAFAKEVFNQLVLQQHITESDGLEGDYIRINLLCNSGAQNQLLESLKPAFQQRIDLLISMVFNSTSVEDYQIALEFLDNALAKLICMRGHAVNDIVGRENAIRSYTDELLKYYRDLVSVRITLAPPQVDGMPSDVLYFDQSPRCADVVSRLEKILNDYKRPVSDKIAGEFLTCYKEYLCMQIDPKKREQAIDFAKTHKKITKYIYGTLPVENFLGEMQKELYSYAKSIFVGLKEISLHGYVSTEYTPKVAADAHFRMRLIDIQKTIQDRITIAAEISTYEPTKHIGYAKDCEWWLRKNDLYRLVVQYWGGLGVTFPLSIAKVNEALDDQGLIGILYQVSDGVEKKLYSKRSSLEGRPHMMVLDVSKAQSYLRREFGEY